MPQGPQRVSNATVTTVPVFLHTARSIIKCVVLCRAIIGWCDFGQADFISDGCKRSHVTIVNLVRPDTRYQRCSVRTPGGGGREALSGYTRAAGTGSVYVDILLLVLARTRSIRGVAARRRVQHLPYYFTIVASHVLYRGQQMMMT